jgi:hypothetical protein
MEKNLSRVFWQQLSPDRKCEIYQDQMSYLTNGDLIHLCFVFYLDRLSSDKRIFQ